MCKGRERGEMVGGGFVEVYEEGGDEAGIESFLWGFDNLEGRGGK